MIYKIYERNMRPSCCQFICNGFPRPRKQFLDPVDRVSGDACKEVAQVGFRVEPVELGSICRMTNYAEQFRNDARYSRCCRPLRESWPCFVRHSSAAQSASSKSARGRGYVSSGGAAAAIAPSRSVPSTIARVLTEE